MTATIKPPDRERNRLRHRLRFSSLETLGFSDANSVWSDSPHVLSSPLRPQTLETRRGRHEALPPEPDPLSDWRPGEIGGRLTGSNIRWGIWITVALLMASVAGLGYWLAQRPAAQEQESLAQVIEHAFALESGLSTLEVFNSRLLDEDPPAETARLFSVEGDARALFDVSGSLNTTETGLRSAALQAASSTVDGVRLVGEAHAFRAAVMPILTPPELETDPELIELDEAARSFGTWQLSLDQLRTALPEGVLTEVTQDLDILSGDLTSIMGDYVDALREDDQSGADMTLLDLSSRLANIRASLNESLEVIQERVSVRIAEAREAIDTVVGS